MENNSKEIISLIFSIKMPIDRNIRRKANIIEDFLSSKYLTPFIVPVPDDLDPAIPRIQIQSKNGHSAILFTQQSVDLNINFDSNFNKDLNACFEYFEERVNLILEIIKSIDKQHFYYIGSTLTYRRVLSESKVKEYFDKYLPLKNENLYDLEFKTTEMIQDKYFINTHTSNFRDYTGEIQNPENQFLLNFSLASKSKEGIQRTIDVNDRYKYNLTGESYNLEYLKNEVLFLTQLMKERYQNDINEI